jgi:hypothetical protein
MAIDVDTKDTTALGDAELTTLGDICADGPAQFDIGLLSKQREEWVLITTAKSGNALQGFSFCTLERIGGTPCVLIGLATVKRTSKRTEVLKALMADQYRRAVLAFPDEDVLIGTRFVDPSGFEAFALSRLLQDVVPRPGHKATGEERAWGRRLARRFGCDARYDDRSFRLSGHGSPELVLHAAAVKAGGKVVVELVGETNPANGEALIAYGWAMAEALADGLATPRS